jgi:predicted Fe-Mo cluster-binding NifX family protein
MKIVLTADQPQLDGALTSTFGDCPYFIFIEPHTMHFEVVANPHRGTTVVDEISAAQIVAGKGVGAVLTGKMGSHVVQVLALEGIKVLTGISGKIDGILEAYKSGKYHDHTPSC